MMRFVATIVALTTIYCLALASAHPWDVVIGAGLSIFVYLFFQSWVFPIGTAEAGGSAVPIWKRVLHFPVFVLVEIWQITRSTWKVMLIVLRIRPLQQGIVGIPLGERTALGSVVMGYTETLAPGSVIFAFDEEADTAWTHVIDASDPDATRQASKEFYDRWQKQVFP